jgi:hypothetical protein
MKRLRVSELALGFLLGFASLLIIFLLSSDIAIHDIETALDAHNGMITAMATIAIAWFTLSLRQATDRLWDAGERQLKLLGDSSAAQSRDMQASIAAAKQSADAAQTAAENVPKTERAYLFLDLNIKSDVEGIFNLFPDQSERRAEIGFRFRNHGRTPAIVESLSVMGQYWAIEGGVPSMARTRLIPIQPGLVVSSDPTGDYTFKFNVTKDQYKQVFPVGRGYIMFWGKITYLDVFQNRHETGWCRANALDGRGWLFGGNHKLNYYT